MHHEMLDMLTLDPSGHLPMRVFNFDWKLIGGDRFSQDFEAENFEQASEIHFDFWGVTSNECEFFNVTLHSNPWDMN